MSIRSRLVVLVLAVIVPAIVASGWAVYTTYGRETDAVERTLRETTRAMALLVEREIEKRETAALILATSPSLLAADLETFRNHALAAIRPLGGHVVLADANRQLLNTSAELGRSLPPLALPTQDAQFDGVQVSPMLRAAGFDEPLIAVTVPVAREGAAAWNLSVTMTPSQLQRVISDQSLPQGWTAAVLDQQGVVVARQPDPARWIGTPAQPDLRERAARDREGIFQTVTLDGSAVTAFFSRSPRYGWTFAIGVPRTVLGTTVSGPLAEIAIAAALLLALAVLAAARVGRGVATAIESLRDSAHAMERGERIEAARSGVQETDEVAHALARASTRIRDANDALERRVAEAVAETQAAQQKLLHTQKMDAIGQLTGGIAHDFNNLLQTLATGQQVLARLVNDPRARPVLEACERAVHKAAKLTQQLLAFGRRQTFSSGSIDLRDQVLGIRELLAGALREDIVLSIELAPDLWPVQADSTQLELA
ncbi:MAG TPA: cache domain-containing protein, partial [Burkholderiaceae bacterium]|nr:cache domain-containing protein [Burkholderiaceae bacterium]